ncbi:MAG: hypothetical protein WC205_10695 [Opitutaceae bacterium]|jgi:hypothetical protein
MKLLSLALVATLLPASVFAERFGSETTLTLQGTYYLTGSDVTQTLSNGDTRDTATHIAVEVSNRSILQTMSDRGLISGTSGYQIVMVAHAHMADGISWFATKKKKTPVAVPADLLNLNVNDGPLNGQLVVDSNALLKSLKQESHNLAVLELADFTCSGMFTQTWQSKAVKNGSVTEVVELVASSGVLNGVIDNPPDFGGGSVTFKLSGAKPVDLALYGIDTSTTTTGGTLSLGGTLTLSGSNTYTGTLIKTGTGGLVISDDTSTVTGGAILSHTDLTTFNGTLNIATGSLTLTNNLGTITLTAPPNLTLTGTTLDFTADFSLFTLGSLNTGSLSTPGYNGTFILNPGTITFPGSPPLTTP